MIFKNHCDDSGDWTRGASRGHSTCTVGWPAGRIQRVEPEEEYIWEAESTGLGDGLKVQGGGDDVSKIIARILACQAEAPLEGGTRSGGKSKGVL